MDNDPTHYITHSKRKNGLNKVGCSCGYVQFFTLGVNSDHATWVHARENEPAEVTTMVEGVVQLKSVRRGMPGRPKGEPLGYGDKSNR